MGVILGLGFIAVSLYGLFKFITDIDARDKFFEELLDGPLSTVGALMIFAGVDVFMYWIFTGNSGFGIDRFRPLSIPLGLWGAIVAIAGLIIVETFGKR